MFTQKRRTVEDCELSDGPFLVEDESGKLVGSEHHVDGPPVYGPLNGTHMDGLIIVIDGDDLNCWIEQGQNAYTVFDLTLEQARNLQCFLNETLPPVTKLSV